MFKEIKILKLTVFVALLVGIIYLSLQRLENTVIYMDNISYHTEDTLRLYVTSNFSSEREELLFVKSLDGDKVNMVGVSVTKRHSNQASMLEGYQVNEAFELFVPFNTPSGLYTLSDTIPIIIRSQDSADITIVYPYANNHLYSKSAGKSLFEAKGAGVSLKRNSTLCNFSKSMVTLFDHLDTAYSIKCISDLDLEDTSSFYNSRLLVFYGISSFWTPKMKSNFLEYVNRGGSALVASDNFMANIFWWEKNTKRLTVKYKNDTGALISWYSHTGENVSDIVGFSYSNGGKAVDPFDTHYTIRDTTHPVFNGVESKYVPIESDIFSGTPITWNDELPFPSGEFPVEDINILAYNHCQYKTLTRNIGAMVLVKKDSLSGNILSMGCRDWFSSENYRSSSVLQKITHNSIDFLLEN